MTLNHTALYCKGWYKTREGGVKTMWMDMAHCIHADGWCPQTKEDVANWCLYRLDEMRKDKHFHYDFKIDLYHFFKNIFDNQRRAKDWYNEELDMYDLIILNYRDIVLECDMDCFTEAVMPDPDVLPVRLDPAYYSEREEKLYPAMMMCDYMDNVKRILPDAKKQELKYYNFENVEAFLRIHNWEDVRVINGSDNLNDCFEITVTGFELKQKMLNQKDENGENVYLDLNIYNSVKNFDMDRSYVCRFKKEEYNVIKIMSVK